MRKFSKIILLWVTALWILFFISAIDLLAVEGLFVLSLFVTAGLLYLCVLYITEKDLFQYSGYNFLKKKLKSKNLYL